MPSRSKIFGIYRHGNNAKLQRFSSEGHHYRELVNVATAGIHPQTGVSFIAPVQVTAVAGITIYSTV